MLEYIMPVIFLAFVGSIIYTIIAVSTATASSDNKMQLASTVYNVTIVNGVFIAILGITTYFYFRTQSAGYDAYVMAMLHVALFLSIMSSSVAALQQLSS